MSWTQLVQVAFVLELVGIAITTIIAPIVFWLGRKSTTELANEIFREKKKINPKYRMEEARREAKKRRRKKTYTLLAIWVFGILVLIIGKSIPIIGGN